MLLGMLCIFSISCKGKKDRQELNPSLQKIDAKSFKNSIGMKMIYLSDDYWVGAYETTKKEYYTITVPKKKIPKDEANMPISIISSTQAIEFCKKLTKYEKENRTLPDGYRYSLPTEKMWRDYVADAKYKDAVFNDYTARKPHDVGTLAPNRLGLYDVRGNVYEWVIDWYKPNNKKWSRVVLGGSYLSNTLENYDIINRSGMSGAGATSIDVGFRVVLIKE